LERAEKREFVAEMKDTLSGAGSIIVAQYTGLTVAEMTELRSSMRAAGGTVKVAKNRLVKLALEGSEAEAMSEYLTVTSLRKTKSSLFSAVPWALLHSMPMA